MSRVMIIAEAGSNHNGELKTAFEIIEKAAAGGADVVKFQGFLADDLLSKDDPDYAAMKRLEIPEAWYPQIIAHCRKNNIQYLSTASNDKSLAWMEKYGAEMYKIASCNINYQPLLEKLVDIGKPLIVSTGMATLSEIVELKAYFESKKFTRYSFLHCVAKYPTPPDQMNLKNITEMKRQLNCKIGFSDHSEGIHMAVAAIALGAEIVEKHVSLDKKGIGMDHKVAITMEQFSEMCRNIREVEAGMKEKFLSSTEEYKTMRRSLHFTENLEIGTLLQPHHIKVTRPEDGISPRDITRVINKKLSRAVKKDAPVSYEDIEYLESASNNQ